MNAFLSAWFTPEVLAFTVTLKPMSHFLKSRWLIYFRKKAKKPLFSYDFRQSLEARGLPI
ncbi:hypothetical protein AYM17_08475 [Coxiella burnetii]|nr:hypothetical protein AYM17_08475 [Coxiella burnetii]